MRPSSAANDTLSRAHDMGAAIPPNRAPPASRSPWFSEREVVLANHQHDNPRRVGLGNDRWFPGNHHHDRTFQRASTSHPHRHGSQFNHYGPSGSRLRALTMPLWIQMPYRIINRRPCRNSDRDYGAARRPEVTAIRITRWHVAHPPNLRVDRLPAWLLPGSSAHSPPLRTKHSMTPFPAPSA